MRTEEQIRERLKELKEERNRWNEKISNYQWSELELIEGSSKYSLLSEKEYSCHKEIKLLEWVLDEL